MYTLVDEQEESFVGNTTVWLVVWWENNANGKVV